MSDLLIRTSLCKSYFIGELAELFPEKAWVIRFHFWARWFCVRSLRYAACWWINLARNGWSPSTFDLECRNSCSILVCYLRDGWRAALFLGGLGAYFPVFLIAWLTQLILLPFAWNREQAIWTRWQIIRFPGKRREFRRWDRWKWSSYRNDAQKGILVLHSQHSCQWVYIEYDVLDVGLNLEILLDAYCVHINDKIYQWKI